MSKELEDLIIEFDELGFEPTILCDQQKEIDSFRNRLIKIRDYLKSIDNAKLSEAFEKTKILRGFNKVELKNDKNVNHSLDIIQQALIKAQKQEEDIIHYKGTIANLRRDNALLKELNVEKKKVLEFIFEKNINIERFKSDLLIIGNFTYRYYVNNFGNYHNGLVVKLLTEEEFNTLKRYFK